MYITISYPSWVTRYIDNMVRYGQHILRIHVHTDHAGMASRQQPVLSAYLLLPLISNRSEGSEENWEQSHDDKTSICHSHPLGS